DSPARRILFRSLDVAHKFISLQQLKNSIANLKLNIGHNVSQFNSHNHSLINITHSFDMQHTASPSTKTGTPDGVPVSILRVASWEDRSVRSDASFIFSRN